MPIPSRPHSRFPLRGSAAGLAATLLIAASSAHAQDDAREWMEQCREQESARRAVHCEVREARLPATGQLSVDAEPNGGIVVQGWDGDEVRVVARVQTHAPDREEARALASEVRVQTEPGRIRTDGPRVRGSRGWSVSYHVVVPRRTDLDLSSTNGGLEVTDVAGRLKLDTTNGGISLRRVAGDVRGETVNGGLRVDLAGDRWEGAGLELETTNGGITLTVPENYSARLETRTVNGGTEIDFPVTVQGRIGKSVEAELGSGGAPIRLVTTNGGIRLRRK
jgi:DUF4097 and DUF4098 domain-containing protein YvlB